MPQVCWVLYLNNRQSQTAVQVAVLTSTDMHVEAHDANYSYHTVVHAIHVL